MNEEPENITVLPNGNINLECRPDKDSILYLEKYNWIYMKDKIDQINNNIRIDFTIKSGGKDFIAKAFLFGLSYDLTREQKTSKFPDQRGFLCGIEYESRAMRAITEIKKAARYRSRQNRKVSFDKPRRVRVQKTGPYISVSIDGKKYSDYLDTNIVTDKTLDNVGFCLLGDCEVTDIEIFTSPAKFRPEEFLENFELRFINNPSLIYHATILENSNKNNFLMVVLKNISEVRRIEKEKETFFEKQKAELEVAKKIQKSFINKALGNILGVDIKYFFLPSNSIGGDLFDTVSLNDHTSYFIIFDVCGKGIPAALINTALKSFFLSAVKNNPEDPESVLREVNEKFMDTFPFDEHHLFATAVCTRIDTKSNSFKISRAGHCYPLYRTSKSSSPEVIKPDGAIIGFFRNSRFPVIERKFGYGDSLFLYTDGIEEIKVNGACPFKLENLIKLISGNGIKQADILIENIRNTIKPHKSGINSYDDSTLVVLSRVPHDES
ncbi:MAG: PP2C family protein-serine/threonine phosphatase [Fibrobacterota bacterium]